MDKTKKKYVILVVVTIVISIIALIGATYALLTMTIEGDKTVSLTAGILKVDFDEGDNINLENTAPMTDSQGQRITPYTFTITNTGNINAYYHVSLEEDNANTLQNSYLKMRLTSTDGYDSGVVKVSSYGTGTFEITNESTLEPEDEVTYTLWMWLDESAGNEVQGTLYQSKIVVESFDREQKSLALQQILDDNTLQEEKAGMFNYSSNGSYYDMNNSTITTNENFITTGLYSMPDEDGTSYYYRGNIENNYVQFGEYKEDYYVYRYDDCDFVTLESCQYYDSSCSESNRVLKYSAGTPMYWRIVRVNGDGSLRLIYSGISTEADGEDLMIADSYYNTNYNDPKYTGYTYDSDNADSTIKNDIELWYNAALANTSYDEMVIMGRFCNDSSGYQSETDYGFPDIGDYMVFSSYARITIASMTNYEEINEPSLICSTTTESYGGSYKLKVGLITADELMLSGENLGVTSDSYLHIDTSSTSYWSMTPASYNTGSASVWNAGSFFRFAHVRIAHGIRPVINVDTFDGFISGDGSSSNPYVLQG